MRNYRSAFFVFVVILCTAFMSHAQSEEYPNVFVDNDRSADLGRSGLFGKQYGYNAQFGQAGKRECEL